MGTNLLLQPAHLFLRESLVTIAQTVGISIDIINGLYNLLRDAAQKGSLDTFILSPRS